MASLAEIERTVRTVLSEYVLPANEYLTTQQAAKYVGLSEEYLEIARHKKDGSGPEYIKLPKVVRYRRADLDKWMEGFRHEEQAARKRAKAMA
jgi:predicted DNA-binding transcriptional regulator AlpA